MPGKVKVKILSARNLPIMDRGGMTTDAFVEIKLGSIMYKTEVARKTLNPQWNSDWFRFEVDDSELQDEPLQIRILDYDTYSANDAIGKVYISLNPLLWPTLDAQKIGKGSAAMSGLSGWIPIVDTMHGIRGEINIIVKVDLFSDVNKFRTSSCGVQFFHSPNIPHGYQAQVIHGFVEELLVNDDPEYHWVDKIRTPRASNEARQVAFLKLSGQVQRKIGLKALELGANAVIGYTQCFDLEGDIGVVARGIGTAVTLVKLQESLHANIVDSTLMEERTQRYIEFMTNSAAPKLGSNMTRLDARTRLKGEPKHAYSSGDLAEASDRSNDVRRMLDQEDQRSEIKEDRALGWKVKPRIYLNKKFGALKSKKYKEPSMESLLARSYGDISTKSLFGGGSLSDLRQKKANGKGRGDGSGMTRLLVHSMLAAHSSSPLSSITERADSPGTVCSRNSSVRRVERPKIKVLTPDQPMRRKFDSTLSVATISTGCASISSDDEESESSEMSNLVCETVSMVVKSVLEHEGENLRPLTPPRRGSNCSSTISEDILKTIHTGTTKVLKDSKGHISESHLIESEAKPEVLERFLAASGGTDDEEKTDGDWIEPGSTTDEPEITDQPKHESMFHNLSEKIHHIQEHIHLPHLHSSEGVIKHHHGRPGLLETAMATILLDKLNIVEVSAGIVPAEVPEEAFQPEKRSGESIVEKIHAIHLPTGHEIKEKIHRITSSGDLEGHGTPEVRPTVWRKFSHDSGLYHLKDRIHRIHLPHPHLPHPHFHLPHLHHEAKHEVLLTTKSEDSEALKRRQSLETIKKRIRFAPLEFFHRPTHPSKDTAKHLPSAFALLESVPRRPQMTTSRSESHLHRPEFVLGVPFLSITDLSDPKAELKLHRKPSISVPDLTVTPTTPTSDAPPQPQSSSSQTNTQIASSLPTNRAECPPASPITKSGASAAAATAPSGRSESLSGRPTHGTPGSAVVAIGPSGGGSKDPTSNLNIYRRSSDSDLSITPKGNSLTSGDRFNMNILRTPLLKAPLNLEGLELLEYPYLTLTKFPPGFIVHIGAMVAARSVKLLERVPNPDEPETRDSWWNELRMEIRSHARAIGCNVVLGYSEVTAIQDDVCVLSATGTAAVISYQASDAFFDTAPRSLEKRDSDAVFRESRDPSHRSTGADSDADSAGKDHGATNASPLTLPASGNCSIAHIPYNTSTVSFRSSVTKCCICRRGKVPDVLLATIEIPDGLQIRGRGCLIQAQVCRQKRDLRSEANAREISEALPFLEYDLHRLLICKLKVKGMNAVFGLRSSVAVSERMIALVTTGTAVYLSALPAPDVPKIVAGNSWSDVERLGDLQRTLVDTAERNREIYQLRAPAEAEQNGRAGAGASDTDESDEEMAAELDLTTSNRDASVLEVDDVQDVEMLGLLMESCPPEGFHVVNTQLPIQQDMEVVKNLQMFTQIWRAKLPLTQLNSSLAKHFQRLLQTIYFKLRTMIPCAISGLNFTLDLPEADEVQILVTGMALGLSEPKPHKFKKRSIAHSISRDGVRRLDDDMIFNLEEDAADVPEPTTPAPNILHTGSLRLRKKSPTRSKMRMAKTLPLRYGVDITPLSYVPGGNINRYLGNLNFFFIRESTQVRENGGISGFVHGFITEVLAIVRSHVSALGGNAIVSFYMNELALEDNIHKNQGQCLISVGGDVVFVSYFVDD